MNYWRFKKIFYLLLMLNFIFVNIAGAASLTKVSDRISTSWPSTYSNHTITFRVTTTIPASGKIVITPIDQVFITQPGFDFTDIDIATSSSLSGPYYDRNIAVATSTAEDGATVNGGASTTLQSIIFNLNSSWGIEAGLFTRIELGINATFGTSGIERILNASSTGAYQINIKTYNENNILLDNANLFIVMVDPVAMAGSLSKIRSNGRPAGFLSYNTSQTIMSLNTNYVANCRYSTTASTSYASMTDTFLVTDGNFHSIIITGLGNGNTYNYYIRCRDDTSVDDATDYVINFTIEGQEDTGGDGEPGSPGGGGGGSGGGDGGGFGQDIGTGFGDFLPYPPPPGLPGIVLTGWAYPSAIVTILKDGVELGKAQGNNIAAFGAYIEELNQGVYTFSLWAEDTNKNKSTTYSTTFWIDEGTQTTVSDIILSPSISVVKNEYDRGETIEVIGYSVPGKVLEIWLYPEIGDIDSVSAIRQEIVVLSDGKWKIFYNTGNIENGIYKLKARSNLGSIGLSGFSQVIDIAIGGELEISICDGADLNGDERVNITDFSILLYYWSTDDDCADQNNDGTVDLTDFSIMMYFWTG